MHWVYNWYFTVVWVAYLVYWQIAAAGAKANQRIESVTSRVLRTVVFFVGILLLSWPRLPIAWLNRYFVPQTALTFWLAAAITLAGLLFAIWARVTLGRNWSRSVTIKQGHELITFGPYTRVRHPIYTGLLTGFAGTAFAVAQVRGLVAFGLIFASLGYKLLLEENFMRAKFGEVYVSYSRHTKALLPWVLRICVGEGPHFPARGTLMAADVAPNSQTTSPYSPRAWRAEPLLWLRVGEPQRTAVEVLHGR